MSTYETHIALDIVVHYDAVKASVGHTDGRFGPKLTPDEPAYIDVWQVKDANGNDVELTDKQMADVKEEIAEHLGERDE